MLNDQTTAAAAPATPTTPDEASAPNEAVLAPDTASAEQLEQLLVLSQAPLTLDAALEQEADTADVVATPLSARRLIVQYLRLLGQVLGVGLITAAVRHYQSKPGLYLGLGFAGALLFAIASTPRRAAGSRLLSSVRPAGLSLLLGLGLGLLVGGILHFSALPHTGAVLVPVGVALSIAAFVARDGRGLIGRDLISAGVMITGLLVWLSVGLGMAAKKIDPPANASTPPAGAAAGADHAPAAESHGAKAAAGDHGAAADAHGEAAKSAQTSAAPAEHGAAAKAADHGATAKAADHGPTAKAADHGAVAKTADHGATPNAADHASTAKVADHGRAAGTSQGAANEEAKEDEVTAADVLVPRKAH